GHPPPGAAALISLEKGGAEKEANLGGGEWDLPDAGHGRTAARPALILNDAGRAGSAVQVRPPSPGGSNPQAEPTDTGRSNQRPPGWSLAQVRSIRNEPASAEFRGTRPPGHRGADRSPTPRTIA